jgi:hypothetical protein
MTRRPLIIIFAVSLVALIGVSVSILRSTAPTEVGDVASVEAALRQPEASTTSISLIPSTGAPPVAAPERRSSDVPIWSGLLAATGPEETIFPVNLRMTSIEVDAPVIATGIDSDSGQMAVPGNVDEVAWYQFGPRPGERGSAVLAAHVDLAGQGPGVFFRLRDLAPGDIIEVEFSDGSAQVFRIEARAIYNKDELPLETIFARQGLPVLTLITCGGSFSESSRRYDSNVVAYAVPVQIQEPGPRL